MASPLTALSSASINSASPSLSREASSDTMYEDNSYAENTPDSTSPASSSPFVDATTDAADPNRENISPTKGHRLSLKGPVDRDHPSPLKMLKSLTSPSHSPRTSVDFANSPRKNSAPKRFPVKPSIASPAKTPVVVETDIDMDEAPRDNEGLNKAMEILEDIDPDGSHDDSRDEGETIDETFAIIESGSGASGSVAENEVQNLMDDTMISTLSDFSAMPDMTMFAKLGRTPRQNHRMSTPVTARRHVDDTNSPSPTPRAHRNVKSRDDGNTTNLILDFTEQMNGFSGRGPSPAKHRISPSKSSMSDMSWYSQNTAATPASNRMSNLLDFDIPPAPTPRSMPSITPRELESLKSNFLSEISNLKASLSGKEAELQYMKTAIGDAEKRVGESMEQLREGRILQEQLAVEKEEWEKRGREMEAVLRNVREEMLKAEQEREDLEGRLEESEGRRAAADLMAQDAQRMLAQMRAGRVTSPTSEAISPTDCTCGGRTVELAVEKVSRELHALYKEKHETKVSALKKSYERRWDKRVKELEITVEDLSKENEDLKHGRDATFTRAEPSQEDLEKEAARDVRTKELEVELEHLGHEIQNVKADNEDLRHLLEEERFEKGKLVQAVDEMIPLMAAYDEMLAKTMAEEKEKPAPMVPETPASATKKSSGLEALKSPARANSVSRIGGLRAPSSSRIGKGIPSLGGQPHHERKGSMSSQGSRPGSGLGLASRSGIMSSIEKMGSAGYRG
ncbi:kinetoplast-associated KAP protein [Rutstroemia sp. NJR-2017a BVV2]|nr:kinetoplast-associated KAP protein [Rutstroemia sp. NJR-2017a BVV2]